VTFYEYVVLKKSRRCQLEEVYEEELAAPRTIELGREVPRVVEPVREVVSSPYEEILEYHDIVKFQEPRQMAISHKRKPSWARELI
jgi:hypothetical protein